MKKKVGAVRALVLFLVVMMSMPVSTFAGEATTGDYLMDIGTKCVRGFGNMLQSPGEIVCGMIDQTQEHKFWGIFTGFGKGVAFMLRRMLVGTTEVGTFMIPAEPTLAPLCQMD